MEIEEVLCIVVGVVLCARVGRVCTVLPCLVVDWVSVERSRAVGLNEVLLEVVVVERGHAVDLKEVLLEVVVVEQSRAVDLNKVLLEVVVVERVVGGLCLKIPKHFTIKFGLPLNNSSAPGIRLISI